MIRLDTCWITGGSKNWLAYLFNTFIAVEVTSSPRRHVAIIEAS
jgi:hypothetical protein